MSDAEQPQGAGAAVNEVRSEPLPEQTDNSVKPEDGDQDVSQDPTPVEGSESEAGA